ncbi:MAG: hypothetical protein QOF42_3209 [Gammaproteobacteria bacterium]|jgi:uncharacterized protein YkwD|nr:hypothetical protein [Gammaproteobacteria bacterium]
MLCCLMSGAAVADPLSAANWDRLQGCGKARILALSGSAQLQVAARRLADGASLQSAIAASGYLASSSSLIHLTGPISDLDVQRLLAQHYCRTLQEPAFKDLGAERRGRDLWLVLAAPVSLPSGRDAPLVARRILELVNEARAAGHRCGGKYFAPVGPLTLDDALTRAALEHSRDMAAHDAFDHRGHDGSTPAARVEHAGYGEHRIVGENIAAGAMNAAEVTEGWLKSPAHCENIMDGRFIQVGIAYAENLKTRSAVFWTQDFASHR